VASVQSFILWQQATMARMRHDHSFIACSCHVHISAILSTYPICEALHTCHHAFNAVGLWGVNISLFVPGFSVKIENISFLLHLPLLNSFGKIHIGKDSFFRLIVLYFVRMRSVCLWPFHPT